LEPIVGLKNLKKRGLTLAEAMIAAALAVVLGFLMLKLIGSGLDAHRKGSESRDAQTGVRTMLGLLVSELRSATPPPLAAPLVVTPVFWPGVWGADQETATESTFYPRSEEGSEDEEVDTSTNRVVYVRAREDELEATGGPLSPFALVELLVPEDRPHQLERRVHPLEGLSVPLNKKQVEGADGTMRDAWLLDMDALAALEAPENPDILYDAGPDARIAFRVGHRTFEPAADPGRTRYPQLFEPGVFRVEVAVAVNRDNEQALLQPWPEREVWSTIREDATEIRIPSVRQN
jgi:hypothetical protein